MGRSRRESIDRNRGVPPREEDPNADLLEKIRQLEEENKRLKDENKAFKEEIDVYKEVLKSKGLVAEDILAQHKELLRRVNMNSTNSSKPPSSDGYRKPAPKSRRKKNGLKRGGQPGHKGYNMPIPHAPNEIVLHHPERCEGCEHLEACSAAGFSCRESRYVVDLVMETRVTEHRVLRSDRCPFSDGPVAGSFPDGVSAHVQYGDSVAIVAGLLNTHGAVSDSRISSLMRSMFGITISPGTVVSMVSRCADKVSGTLKEIRKLLIAGDVDHFDESGARMNGKLHWVQCSSSGLYTLLTMSAKRGVEGMVENGVLPEFKGIAVHDFWRPYWRFDGIGHGTCGAHLLRELTGIREMEPDHEWPVRMMNHLMFMKTAKDSAVEEGRDSLTSESLEWLDAEYDRIVELAERECPAPPEPLEKRRGRRRKGKERSLIERFRDHRDEVRLFVHDFRVPFDNNQAERDIRNVKTKVKVAGCFRSLGGANDYLGIMSYLGTGRKHGVDPFKALAAAFKGQSRIVLEGS